MKETMILKFETTLEIDNEIDINDVLDGVLDKSILIENAKVTVNIVGKARNSSYVRIDRNVINVLDLLLQLEKA